ncbi:uncharacterized protein LOC136041424 isoform X2 [Artemia franciscana]|uniref:uncharacterized protein LOC136041424 isoform X2 n=1 Tax=Artemia franciscana TaxID=6661 RepID=UPI0032DA73B0
MSKRRSMTPTNSEVKPFVRRCACLRHKEAAVAAGLIQDDAIKERASPKKTPRRPSSVPPKRKVEKAREMSQHKTSPTPSDLNSLECDSNSIDSLNDSIVRKQVIPLRYSTTVFLKISSTRRRYEDSIDFEVIELNYEDKDGKVHEPVQGSKGWYISEHCLWD